MTLESLQVRPETPADFAAVRQLTIDAFSASDLGYHGEADLIEAIRENCEQYLSLVACWEEKVVGHCCFSPVVLESDAGPLQGMGLAPMAVAPVCQRQGIGSALIEAGLTRLDAADCPFVAVLGHPEYYPRFGFQLAGQYGISHGFAGIPQEVFFVRVREPSPKLPASSQARFSLLFGEQQL